MASSNCPAAPTKGAPCKSSCSPGASPTTSQRARRLPAPKTTLWRAAHSPQARHCAASRSSASQSMRAMRAARAARAAAAASGMGVAAGAGAAGAAGWIGMARRGGALTGTACGVAAGVGAGSQTRMPISCSMARWRVSSCKPLVRFSGGAALMQRLLARCDAAPAPGA